MSELIIDSFAGGGGASHGIFMATGRHPNIAINHDAHAIATHRANHPETHHYCEDVWHVDPVEATGGRPVGLAWFSPDCTHFSRAKGGKPREKKIRGLAWVVVRWAKRVQPRVIVCENVAEFQTWGPLLADGSPCPSGKGKTFRLWVNQLRGFGYRVEWRELVACDFGAPTTRKRLFLIARCDGQPIVWPEPTHAADPAGGLHTQHLAPYRTAAQCIDWSIPCPSIFERKKPLAEATMKRIARGIQRFVIEAPEPFIVTYYGPEKDGDRLRDINDPLATQTTENRFAVVAPTLVQTGYGEREGQEPRALDIEKPLGTVVASGKHAMVSAFLSKFQQNSIGQDAREPAHTVMAGAPRFGAVAAHLTKLYGTSTGAEVTKPMPTITGGGQHIGEVRAFLVKYYGCGTGQGVTSPMDTVTSVDRFGLVTVEGEQYQIADIGLRMLQPRELARAQGFPDSYVLLGTKTQQVRMIGNSVCPDVAAAIVRANYAVVAERAAV